MIDLKSCWILSCFVLTLELVIPDLVKSQNSNSAMLWTVIGELERGDKIVFKEDIIINAKNLEKTYFMPNGYEFTRVRIQYPKKYGLCVSYSNIPAKYKLTIKPKTATIPSEDVKYNIDIRANFIKCKNGSSECKQRIMRRIELLELQNSKQRSFIEKSDKGVKPVRVSRILCENCMRYICLI
ncbi:hypothetical protein QAD02_010008 [Eretmocerus hayati]|uniref:Uncharacterized protein n=1 Tax=Eretmocerus hayati TaxID=131215 RepID=A0ACC2NB11_9HYME|nr:hypothetical protein QAD02_010008 [Eretmocerus hayati]